MYVQRIFSFKGTGDDEVIIVTRRQCIRFRKGEMWNEDPLKIFLLPFKLLVKRDRVHKPP